MKMTEFEPDESPKESPSIACILDSIRKSTSKINHELMTIESQILDWFEKNDHD